MNWKHLYFGHVSPTEVAEAIKDDTWQATRRSMKGISLEDKYRILANYYFDTLRSIQEKVSGHSLDVEQYEHEIRMLRVRCTNYVTALSRGGLLKCTDYRKVL